MKRLRHLKIPAVSIKIELVVSIILWMAIILGAAAIFDKSIFAKVMGMKSEGDSLGQVKSGAFYPVATGPASPAPTSSVLPSPIPSASPSSSPTVAAIVVSPTPLPARVNSNRESQAIFVQPLYSGPPIAAPAEKKELFVANFDSPIVGGWVIEEDQGTELVGGKVGQGLSFGSGKLLLSGGETFAASGSLSFWLKIESEPKRVEVPIIAWNFDGSHQEFSLFELSYVDNILQFSLYEESLNQDDIHAEIDTFVWHHVVLTWDLTKEPYRRAFFLDGKKVAEGGFTFAPVTRDQPKFLIGGSVGNRNSPKFSIDELILINWAKSEEEIAGAQ